jgi:hypothetical protein
MKMNGAFGCNLAGITADVASLSTVIMSVYPWSKGAEVTGHCKDILTLMKMAVTCVNSGNHIMKMGLYWNWRP